MGNAYRDTGTVCIHTPVRSLAHHTLRHQAAGRRAMIPRVRMRLAVLILHPEAFLAKVELANGAAPGRARDVVIQREAVLTVLPRLLRAAGVPTPPG